MGASSTMSDNPAAALARKRWAGTTKSQRREAMDRLRSMQTMTPEQRSERARKAAAASAKVRSASAKRKKLLRRKSKA